MKSLLYFFLLLSLALAQDMCADDPAGRCVPGVDNSFSCQCNAACEGFGDCCPDYREVCLSCKDRCNVPYMSKNECQCNADCPAHGNCCSDFDEFCDGSSGGVSNADLIELSELLFSKDVNNCGSLITMNYQGKTTQCSNNNDLAPLDMFSRFDDSIWTKPTIAAFEKMFDNYERSVKVNEDRNAEERAEEAAFLDEVMKTDVMIEAYNFLNTKGVFPGSIDAFRTKLDEIWFDLYDRDGTSATVLGSSGFEHVFLGESKGGDVSGFHNWIYYHNQEEQGFVDYKGYLTIADFGNGSGGVTNVFNWYTDKKCIGGFFVGTSPELDMAVKSVCFLARLQSDCVMSFNGVTFSIVTFNQKQNGLDHVASAYPVFD